MLRPLPATNTKTSVANQDEYLVGVNHLQRYKATDQCKSRLEVMYT